MAKPYGPPVYIPSSSGNPSSLTVYLHILSDDGEHVPIHSHVVQVDTGSRGVLLPVSLIPKSAVKGGTYTLTYEPSGTALHGHYYTLKYIGIGTHGESKIICTDATIVGVDYVENTKTASPKKLWEGGMFGIGFGHLQIQTPQSGWPMNLFTEATTTAHLYHSYLITTSGITVGIQQCPSQQYQQLENVTDESYKRWMPALVTITCTKDGKTQSSQGRALLDTGIKMALIAGPPDENFMASSVPNSEISVSWVDTPVSYKFTIGPNKADSNNTYEVLEGTPDNMKPDAVEPVSPHNYDGGKAFINTGIHVLNRWSYYYDEHTGKIAFVTIANS